jgi:putative tryptophan/tyrosine transport system substrate-binding protein
MNRRNVVLALLALGAVPRASLAQPQGKLWRIGHLSLAPGPDKLVEGFREELRDLGYVEGHNLLIEYRWAAGDAGRLKEFATELVRLKVDVIVAISTTVGSAAKRATSTIPIVVTSTDPVGAGLVGSLARPGGNVTGVTWNSTELAGKRFQLLREVVPKLARVAILVWKNADTKPLTLGQARESARQMDIALVIREPAAADDLGGMFEAMQRERAQTLIVPQSPFTDNHGRQIADLARLHRLPTMFETRGPVDAGGLMSYGASPRALRRRVARYVDRILKGARPADLPIEQPNVYELVVNLKTANALGLAIPQLVLASADEVIQ